MDSLYFSIGFSCLVASLWQPTSCPCVFQNSKNLFHSPAVLLPLSIYCTHGSLFEAFGMKVICLSTTCPFAERPTHASMISWRCGATIHCNSSANIRQPRMHSPMETTLRRPRLACRLLIVATSQVGLNLNVSVERTKRRSFLSMELHVPQSWKWGKAVHVVAINVIRTDRGPCRQFIETRFCGSDSIAWFASTRTRKQPFQQANPNSQHDTFHLDH